MSYLTPESKPRQLALFEMWQGAIGFAFFYLRQKGSEIELVGTEANIIRYESGTFGIRGLLDIPGEPVNADQAMLAAAEKYGGLIYDKDNKKWTFYFYEVQRDPLVIRSAQDIATVADLVAQRYKLDQVAQDNFEQQLTRLVNFPMPQPEFRTIPRREL